MALAQQVPASPHRPYLGGLSDILSPPLLPHPFLRPVNQVTLQPDNLGVRLPVTAEPFSGDRVESQLSIYSSPARSMGEQWTPTKICSAPHDKPAVHIGSKDKDLMGKQEPGMGR